MLAAKTQRKLVKQPQVIIILILHGSAASFIRLTSSFFPFYSLPNFLSIILISIHEISFTVTIMTDKLPPNLLALFAPRPPLRYLPHADHAAEERTTRKIDGIAGFLQAFREHQQQDFAHSESWYERKTRKKVEKKERIEKELTEGVKACKFSRGAGACKKAVSKACEYHANHCFYLDKPSEDPQIRGDAYKTLFVARLSYDAKEADLEREFGRFGPIERVCVHLFWIHKAP